jgi:hypothetical protein
LTGTATLIEPGMKATEQQRMAEVGELAALELASKGLLTFTDFLDYVYILEPPQPIVGIAGGKARFQKWPHLMEMAEVLTRERFIDVLKARQDGFSWLVSAYVTWLFRFFDGSVILELSRGEKESYALLKKAKFIYRNLPQSWQIPIDADSGSEFSLQGMSSKITALPSTEDAGRSETASVVVQDEADFHKALEENFLAVKPTVDAGGQIIMGSTANKRNNRSVFKNLYRGAPENGWYKLFWGWRLRPGRDDAWYERVKREAKDLPDAQELGVALYMEQEYPESEAEALKPANALAAFDLENLERMKADTRQPKRTIGHINIYHEPEWRKAYAAGTDASHGVGQDYAVTVVLDKDTGYVVADIMGQGIGPDQLAVASLELMEIYRNPRWAIEDNGEDGAVVFNTVFKEKYPNHYKRQINRTGKRVKGWHTDKPSRAQLWFDLIDAVDAGGVTIPHLAGLDQFFTVIRHPDNGYKPEAMIGAHDDYPTAVGLALQAATQATRRSAPSVEEEAPRRRRGARIRQLQPTWHRGF